jgi:hypothetical protein
VDAASLAKTMTFYLPLDALRQERNNTRNRNAGQRGCVAARIESIRMKL